MGKRKAEDDGRDGQDTAKKPFPISKLTDLTNNLALETTVLILTNLTQEMDIDTASDLTQFFPLDGDPAYQNLSPLQALEKISSLSVKETKGIMTLSYTSEEVLAEILSGRWFPEVRREGMLRLNKATTDLIISGMLRKVTFCSRLDLASTTDILPLQQLRQHTPLIRDNIRLIRLAVNFTGKAEYNATEQWARLWYEPGLLRPDTRKPDSQQVKVDVHVSLANETGFQDPTGEHFWTHGQTCTEVFLHEVRKMVHGLVEERGRKDLAEQLSGLCPGNQWSRAEVSPTSTVADWEVSAARTRKVGKGMSGLR
jgi:hypothetical protein